MRVDWIYYEGKKILFCDYSNVKCQKKMSDILKGSHIKIESSSSKLIILNDVTGAVIGPDFVAETKMMGFINRDKIGKNCTVGISGLKRVRLKEYNMFVKSENPSLSFETKEEALDYLVS